MSPTAQSWIQLAVLLVGLGATLVAAINHQTHYIDRRIDDLKSDLAARIEALDKRLSEKIDALEKRLIERIERLEHPVTRP